jgi:hypothetical protein
MSSDEELLFPSCFHNTGKQDRRTEKQGRGLIGKPGLISFPVLADMLLNELRI